MQYEMVISARCWCYALPATLVLWALILVAGWGLV
jgi:hypothetical protein